jgi:hypothetical protein
VLYRKYRPPDFDEAVGPSEMVGKAARPGQAFGWGLALLRMEEPTELARAGLEEFRALAERHVARLEAMFGRKGIQPLRRSCPDHPAVRQIAALKQFAATGVVAYGAELKELGEIATMQIDQRMWPLPASDDDPWSFLPSERLRSEMKRRLREPGSFGDTLAELYVWARLRDDGFDVSLTEHEGTADLEIRRQDAIVFGDVKRVRLGSSPATVGSALTKANRQVKRSAGEEAAGVAFISITRPTERAALDDRVPADVQVFLDELRGELAGSQNRSIAAAIVYWDDIVVVEREAEMGYFFRRRATVIRHSNARGRLAIAADDLTPTAWFGVGVRWPLPDETHWADLPVPTPRARGSVVATPAFQQMNQRPIGVRAEHAIELFSNPDKMTMLPGNVVLATRDIAATPEFTLLGIASIREDKTQISMVFKLYGVPRKGDPESLLGIFLSRYGLPVRVGDSVASLHPAVPAPNDGALVVIDNPPAEGFSHLVAEMGEAGPRTLHCVFGFDAGRYKAKTAAKSA